MRTAVLFIALSSAFAGVNPADQAFVPLLQRSDRSLVDFSSVARQKISDTYDLVLILGRHGEFPAENEYDRLGVFLQERKNRRRIYLVGSEPNVIPYCEFQIRVMNAQEVAFDCGESIYGAPHPGHHILYDLRTRSVVRSDEFEPFRAEGVFDQHGKNPIIAMYSGQRLVPVMIDARGRFRPADLQNSPSLTRLGIKPEMTVEEVWSVTGMRQAEKPFDQAWRVETVQDDDFSWPRGFVEQTRDGEKRYLVPQSTQEKYRSVRPDEPTMDPEAWEKFRKEGIGPFQLEGRRVWFGTQFMSGDLTGIGSFGYFDMDNHAWTLYSPDPFGLWSTSALLVEPEAIWLGLSNEYDEGAQISGGIVRWDRRTEQTVHLPFDWSVRAFVRRGDAIYVAANKGLAIIRDGHIERFIVTLGRSGYDVVPVTPSIR